MSYEADAHKAQMAILRLTLLAPDAGFAELQRAAGLESDATSFHLKQLAQAGYLVKRANGRYSLSRQGKEYANRMDTDERVIEKQPKLSVALIIDNSAGQFLAQQRLKHPYYGFWGLPTGKIRWGEQLTEAAARELLEETGLTAELTMKGLYHKIDVTRDTGELLEDKYFCLIYGVQPVGQLIERDEGHQNCWMTGQDIQRQTQVFESVTKIVDLARGPGFSYVEQVCQYEAAEY